jgi:hypothetical protein
MISPTQVLASTPRAKHQQMPSSTPIGAQIAPYSLVCCLNWWRRPISPLRIRADLAYVIRENFAASYFAGGAARLAMLILSSFAPAVINGYFQLEFRQGTHLMLLASINLGCPFAIAPDS